MRLRELLDKAIVADENGEDYIREDMLDANLVVKLSEVGLGPCAACDIEGFYLGFDWDKGRLILEPTEPIVHDKFLWTPASERMPRKHQDVDAVFVFRKNGRPKRYANLRYDEGEKVFYDETGELIEAQYCTHWCVAPRLPKLSKDNKEMSK